MGSLKPAMCRKISITIPVSGEECEFWLIPVTNKDEIIDPDRDHAWIDQRGVLWVFNGKDIVSINDPDTLHVQWGHIDGHIEYQDDLWSWLQQMIRGIRQNDTDLGVDEDGVVNVSVPIMHIQVNESEIEPNNYTVNIDLSEYAKHEEIPAKLSELENDQMFITNADLNDAIPENVSQFNNDALYQTENDMVGYYKKVGDVETFEDLPGENVREGDVYNVTSASIKYVYNGADWEVLERPSEKIFKIIIFGNQGSFHKTNTTINTINYGKNSSLTGYKPISVLSFKFFPVDNGPGEQTESNMLQQHYINVDLTNKKINVAIMKSPYADSYEGNVLYYSFSICVCFVKNELI